MSKTMSAGKWLRITFGEIPVDGRGNQISMEHAMQQYAAYVNAELKAEVERLREGIKHLRDHRGYFVTDRAYDVAFNIVDAICEGGT